LDTRATRGRSFAGARKSWTAAKILLRNDTTMLTANWRSIAGLNLVARVLFAGAG